MQADSKETWVSSRGDRRLTHQGQTAQGAQIEGPVHRKTSKLGPGRMGVGRRRLHHMGWPAAVAMDGRPAMAGRASATRNHPVQHHSIPGPNTGHLRADLEHHPGALMPHDQRTLPPQRGVIGMAQARSPNLHQHLITLG